MPPFASKTPSFSSWQCCCGLHWLRKEVLALEETPNYLAAVKFKLNNPRMGKAGEAKSIFPEAVEERTTRQANILHEAVPGGIQASKNEKKPGMSWQTPGQGRGQTSSAHSSAPVSSPSRPWDKSNRKEGKGGKKCPRGRWGGEEGTKRQHKGEEKLDQRQKFIRDNGIIYFSCC